MTAPIQETIILRCNTSSVFHMGLAGGNANASLSTTESFIRSDRLFSALTATMARIYPHAVNGFVQAVSAGAIRFSSAFFCVEKAGQHIFFLPAPVSCQARHLNNHKQVKAVQWVSAGVYQQGIGPEQWQAAEANEPQGQVVFLNKAAICLPAEAVAFGLRANHTHFYQNQLQPHVKRHTNEQTDRLYQTADIALTAPAPGVQTHYYLLYSCHPTEQFTVDVLQGLNTQLKALLRIMGDEGLGGERSNGKGRYNGITVLPGHRPIGNATGNATGTSQYKYTMGLSLVSPSLQELPHATLYDIEKRGGRPFGGDDGSDQGGDDGSEGGTDATNRNTRRRLKTVYLLREGAVYAQAPAGQLLNIAPFATDTPFLRNGKAFCIPLHPNYAPQP